MKTERTQIRIVAGSLRGRRLTVVVHEGLRPTPQMVREALFSILGNAIPDQPFYDIFAGTGVVGLEAISRGASRVYFVERDFQLANAIEGYMTDWEVTNKGQILRTDVYRWAERWVAPPEPVNLFLSPPFPDLTGKLDPFTLVVQTLQTKAAPGSVLVVQAEDGFASEHLPDAAAFEVRKYGRNLLLIWVKPLPETPPPATPE
jgi:16S rRNA (guanine(966)-N(2))-methyltransferase RsmD